MGADTQPALPLQTVFVELEKKQTIKHCRAEMVQFMEQRPFLRRSNPRSRAHAYTVIQLGPRLLNTHAQHMSYVMLNNDCIDR